MSLLVYVKNCLAMAKTKQIPILVLVFTIYDGLILIFKSLMIDLSLSKQIEPYNLLLQHYILLWNVFFVYPAI